MPASAVREVLRDAVGNFGALGGQVLLASPTTGEAAGATVEAQSPSKGSLGTANFMNWLSWQR
jgi:hypothetical protein